MTSCQRLFHLQDLKDALTEAVEVQRLGKQAPSDFIPDHSHVLLSSGLPGRCSKAYAFSFPLSYVQCHVLSVCLGDGADAGLLRGNVGKIKRRN